MTHKEYNGYYNYETWLVALWIDNDQFTQEQLHEMAETIPDRDAYDLSLQIEAWVTDAMIPDLGATLAADLVSGALSEVNWHEIAENAIEGLDPIEPEPPPECAD